MIAGKAASTASRTFISSVATTADRRCPTATRSCRREKCAFEGWLERAPDGLADAKFPADLRLAGAENFDVDLTGSAQRVAHGFKREHGRITIATEMTEDDPVDFSRKQFFDHGGGGVIGKMSVARLNPLFYRPRPMRVVL